MLHDKKIRMGVAEWTDGVPTSLTLSTADVIENPSVTGLADYMGHVNRQRYFDMMQATYTSPPISYAALRQSFEDGLSIYPLRTLSTTRIIDR